MSSDLTLSQAQRTKLQASQQPVTDWKVSHQPFLYNTGQRPNLKEASTGASHLRPKTHASLNFFLQVPANPAIAISSHAKHCHIPPQTHVYTTCS